MSSAGQQTSAPRVRRIRLARVGGVFATVAAALALALAGSMITVGLGAAAAQAVNNDGSSPFATYNMHGSDNGLAWRSEIQRLAATNPVVALQEAGSGPPLPANINRSNFRQIRL